MYIIPRWNRIPGKARVVGPNTIVFNPKDVGLGEEIVDQGLYLNRTLLTDDPNTPYSTTINLTADSVIHQIGSGDYEITGQINTNGFELDYGGQSDFAIFYNGIFWSNTAPVMTDITLTEDSIVRVIGAPPDPLEITADINLNGFNLTYE